jgi:dinuclear metal center YbgI/SA1388 family protein
MTVALRDVVDYLDVYLRIADVEDSGHALNGLQVDADRPGGRIAAAVDACQTTIDRAGSLGADLLLVHHGLFWDGLEPLTGRHGRRVRALYTHGLSVYAAHVPLDIHPEVGNNAVLADLFGLTDTEWFGEYKGQVLGVAGTLQTTRADLVELVRAVVGGDPMLLATGPDTVRRVGIISGGGGAMIREAMRAGVDAFITGEGNHHSFFDAEEWGVNVIYAGHYATETVGVKALAKHVAHRFEVAWEFIDHPTGL